MKYLMLLLGQEDTIMESNIVEMEEETIEVEGEELSAIECLREQYSYNLGTLVILNLNEVKELIGGVECE